jgi:arylformamidase
MPLDALIGPAVVVEIPPDAASITAEHLRGNELAGAERILFKTRNSAFWGDDSAAFRTDFTFLETDAASALVDRGIKLVGIDYLSIEAFNSERHETHTTLLSNGVVIVEGLDLRNVIPGHYELICLPLKIATGTGDGAPARVVLRRP